MKRILLLTFLITYHLFAFAQVVVMPPFFGVQHQSVSLSITAINNSVNLGEMTVSVSIKGSIAMSERGIVYNTARLPTTANSKYNAGSGAGNTTFLTTATGLSPTTPSTPRIYYVRPYATTSSGATFYGPEYAFMIYGYTGSLQTFTVPAQVNEVTMQAVGGQGGSITYSGTTLRGGFGASMRGVFSVTSSEVIDILVAGRGTSSTYLGAANNNPNPGGGGGSFIVRKDQVTLANVAMLVAGGGGGAAWPGIDNGSNIWPNPSWQAIGRPGLTGTSGGNSSQVSNAPATTIYSGGTDGWGGIGNHGGGGGGFKGDGTSPAGAATGNAYGRKYPGIGGYFLGRPECTGGYGGGGAGFGGVWVGGGGGGGYSGGAGCTLYGASGGGGSYNAGTSQQNYDGDSYGQQGDGRVVISWKTP